MNASIVESVFRLSKAAHSTVAFKILREFVNSCGGMKSGDTILCHIIMIKENASKVLMGVERHVGCDFPQTLSESLLRKGLR